MDVARHTQRVGGGVADYPGVERADALVISGRRSTPAA
jgi:hypothetical protein